jgi:hypothetical protein
MYSKRWPGFQLAVQSPKAGQLLVVDQENTYALKVFHKRNVHSPFFFPGEEGYLIYADKNSNEPQIVGEEGARPPLKWLPQSDYSYARGNKMISLDSKAFGGDKMVGYTRAEPSLWKTWIKIRARGMVKAGDNLFLTGVPDEFDKNAPFDHIEGKKGAKLITLSSKDGKKLNEIDLDHPPVFDGMIAAHGSLYISLLDGSIICLSGN